MNEDGKIQVLLDNAIFVCPEFCSNIDVGMGVDSSGCDLVGGVRVLLVVELGKLDLVKDLAVHRDFEPVGWRISEESRKEILKTILTYPKLLGWVSEIITKMMNILNRFSICAFDDQRGSNSFQVEKHIGLKFCQ